MAKDTPVGSAAHKAAILRGDKGGAAPAASPAKAPKPAKKGAKK